MPKKATPPKKKVVPKKKAKTPISTKAKKGAVKKVSAPKKSEKKPVPAKVVVQQKTEDAEHPQRASGKALQSLRGMRDIAPNDGQVWQHIAHVSEAVATAYNFQFTETPILEEANLFVRSLGKGTDVVEKEMYVFEDRDGSKIALRPENTAGIVRAYVGNGMHTLPQPVKMWYSGPMFRHERPQAGRYRQFHQFGCETIGGRDPVIDTELIAVAYHTLFDLGLETQVHINSIGSAEDRAQYVVELVAYLRSKRSYLCENCKKRLNKNPLRTLDCKEDQCQPIKDEVPQIIDWLSEDAKKFFVDVLEYLDALKIPYVLAPTLVRGLDYYCDTVFELYQEEDVDKSQGALGGGGRYDPLVQMLGGQPGTGASGFSLGVERIAHALKKKAGNNTNFLKDARVPLFFAQLGEQARRRGLYLLEQLRKEGIMLHHNFGKTSLKAQLELADKAGATHTFILGQKEVLDETIIIRDMESGIQEIVDQRKLASYAHKLIRA